MSNKFRAELLCIALVVCQSAPVVAGAKIVQLEGEVKIRRGLEENWEWAKPGMPLEEIDTILTGENGAVVLAFDDDGRFKLGGNSVLDVADLRKISEQELFLILMSQKISRLKPAGGSVPLRIGEVSTIRGRAYEGQTESPATASAWWRREVNAAQALLMQDLLTNAAVKWHRIREKFPAQADCGEVSFFLAQTLEQLRQAGQARDEYQRSLQQARTQECRDEETAHRTAMALEKLKQQ